MGVYFSAQSRLSNKLETACASIGASTILPTSLQLLAMPAVRKRWHLLPSSLIPALKAHEGGAPQHHILRPIGVPPELSELNQVLPPAQYGDGEGMAFLLSRPMSSSDTNLKDLDKPSGQSGVE